MLSVKVPTKEGGEQEHRNCTTQKDIFDAAEPVLTERFTGAFASPFYTGKLFDDLGFIGDTECVQQVLEGTYEIPEGTDRATRLVLEECAHMYQSMSSEELATFVTKEGYQYY